VIETQVEPLGTGAFADDLFEVPEAFRQRQGQAV
jgi:hypothetical protein